MGKKNYKNNKQRSNFREDRNGSSNHYGSSNAGTLKRAAQAEDFRQTTDRIKEIKRSNNDSAFYYSNESYIEPFAKIPFNNILGLTTPGFKTQGQYGFYGNNLTLPGMMVIDTIPVMGYSYDSLSPLNVAALKNYAFVRHENSGSAMYDASNLMQYNSAVIGLIPMFLHVKRAFDCIGLYHPLNRYTPDDIVTALGFNPVDLRANLISYIGRYNLLVAQFNKFAVPAGFRQQKRWEYIYSRVFLDRNSNKAQLYAFKPIALPRYDESGDTPVVNQLPVWPKVGPGNNKHTIIERINENTLSVKAYLDAIEASLQALFYSNSIGIMSGDTMKAYGVDSLYKLEPYSVNGTNFVPDISDDILKQITNIHTAPFVYPRVDMDQAMTAMPIEWVDDLIRSTSSVEIIDEALATSFIRIHPSFNVETSPEFGALAAQFGNSTLLNIDNPNPQTKDIVEMTRTKTLATFDPTISENEIIYDTFGTEIYTNMHIIYRGEDSNTLLACTFNSFLANSIDGTYTNINIAQIWQLLSLLSNFDWAPVLYTYEASSEVTSPALVAAQVTSVISELDNAVYIERDTLKNLNYALNQEAFSIN